MAQKSTISPSQTLELPKYDPFPYYEETVTESTQHFAVNQYLQYALEEFFREQPEVFVGANNFLYWDPKSKKKKQSPDIYVCFGVPKGYRRSYKVWMENGVVPQVIFEITSTSSRLLDQGTKKATYEMLGVEEYYTFDPFGEYIPDKLRAFRNQQGTLKELKGKRIHSARLGLDLRVEGEMLRFFLPGSSVRLLTYQEAQKARAEAERAQAEADRARKQAEQAQKQAEQAQKATERARAELERRNQLLERELEALRRRLESP